MSLITWVITSPVSFSPVLNSSRDIPPLWSLSNWLNQSTRRSRLSWMKLNRMRIPGGISYKGEKKNTALNPCRTVNIAIKIRPSKRRPALTALVLFLLSSLRNLYFDVAGRLYFQAILQIFRSTIPVTSFQAKKFPTYFKFFKVKLKRFWESLLNQFRNKQLSEISVFCKYNTLKQSVIRSILMKMIWI